MKKEDLRIIFMGTPDFAVASLKALVEEGYKIVGVVTMPDKPAGRGYKLQPSAVKEYAQSQGLYLMQPEKLKDPSFLEELSNLHADLQIVVAFRMLPEVVWNMPPQGTFNLHASLLPHYRGAAPINWAIIKGEKKTGNTTFFLTHQIDTGSIIFQQETDILPQDSAGVLHDKLMAMGASLVTRTVDAILLQEITAVAQPQADPNKTAPKLTKENTRIDWTKPGEEIYNMIRGLSPFPTAWTEWKIGSTDPIVVKIFESIFHPTVHSHLNGSIHIREKKQIQVAVSDGYIEFLHIQLPGKRKMAVEDFLRGCQWAEDLVGVI